MHNDLSTYFLKCYLDKKNHRAEQDDNQEEREVERIDMSTAFAKCKQQQREIKRESLRAYLILTQIASANIFLIYFHRLFPFDVYKASSSLHCLCVVFFFYFGVQIQCFCESFKYLTWICKYIDSIKKKFSICAEILSHIYSDAHPTKVSHSMASFSRHTSPMWPIFATRISRDNRTGRKV